MDVGDCDCDCEGEEEEGMASKERGRDGGWERRDIDVEDAEVGEDVAACTAARSR